MLSVGRLCYLWDGFAICGITLLSVGRLCYLWDYSAIRGTALLSVGLLCYLWVGSAICGPTLLSVGRLCYLWVDLLFVGRPCRVAIAPIPDSMKRRGRRVYAPFSISSSSSRRPVRRLSIRWISPP